MTNVIIAFALVPGQQPIINIVERPDDSDELDADNVGDEKSSNLSYIDEEQINKMVQKYVRENFPASVGNKRVPILITGVTTIRRRR